MCVFVCVCVLANVLSLALSGADGRTALQLACAMGRAECVQVLLDHGATVDTADDSTFFWALLGIGLTRSRPQLVQRLSSRLLVKATLRASSCCWTRVPIPTGLSTAGGQSA